MKIGLEAVDLFVFNAFRLTLSALVLGICTWLENRAQTPATAGTRKIRTNYPGPFRMWTTIILFSIFTGGLYQILFAVGIDQTTAGNTALIISSMPMWIAVLSFFLLHEKLGWAWIGLIVAFLGTALVAMQKGSLSFDSENQFGNLMVLTAALAWALAAVISSPDAQIHFADSAGVLRNRGHATDSLCDALDHGLAKHRRRLAARSTGLHRLFWRLFNWTCLRDVELRRATTGSLPRSGVSKPGTPGRLDRRLRFSVTRNGHPHADHRRKPDPVGLVCDASTETETLSPFNLRCR